MLSSNVRTPRATHPAKMPEMMRAILSQRRHLPNIPARRPTARKKAGMLARAGLRKVHSTRWLVICLGLTACSSIETAPMDPGPPPDFVTVKRSLTRVASEYHMVDGLEYFGPIRANAPSSIPWTMCLRSAPRTTYAAFFKGDEYIRSRMSVIEDRCDSKSYRPFPK